jgi:hypothetical protein
MTRRNKGQSLSGRADSLLPLQVRYFKVMRRGLTYPVQISWKSAERGVAAKPVTLRLEVAGALVVPAERVMRPNDPDDETTFFVTPLSSGKLRHCVIEVRQDNAKLFEMPLKARVGTRWFTLFLIVMAFLVPWLLVNYCKTPFQIDKLGPKDSLKVLIEGNTPELDELAEKLPESMPIKVWVRDGTEHVATWYAQLHEWCNEYPIALYTALGFLVLALFSAWRNRPKRKWRTSEPIPLPE